MLSVTPRGSSMKLFVEFGVVKQQSVTRKKIMGKLNRFAVPQVKKTLKQCHHTKVSVNEKMYKAVF